MKAFGVFEGGGAKGYAHVGAFQAIEARRMELAAVAGSSIGAVIALLIAAGFTGDELFKVEADRNSGLLASSWVDQLNQTDWAAFENFRDEYLVDPRPNSFGPGKVGYFSLAKMGWSLVSAFRRHRHLFDQLWTRFGLTDASGFRTWLDQSVRKKIGREGGPIRFKDLKIPLKVVAGDLLTGKIRVFGGTEDADLDAVDAAVASASYPLFFQPYSFAGGLFVDGGLLSNLPAWVFDEERLNQSSPIPTFGFRFTEVPLLRRKPSHNGPPTSFPQFVHRLALTSIFGAQALGERGIEEYYAFDLAADIETLAFHEIEEKAPALVKAGRQGVTEFFDIQLGPSDPDEMAAILSTVANFAMQALDKFAKSKLGRFRAFVLIKTSEQFVRVAYSANATDDADDRLMIRTNSPGPATCLYIKEPVVVFVPKIADTVRTNPYFKYEHAARPRDVVSGYAVPIFADPREWSHDAPQDRNQPIAVLLIDSTDDLLPLLMRPEFEDRLATFAQICGEYLRGAAVQTYGPCVSIDEELSELLPLAETGFFVSSRKRRALFQDEEVIELVERIERRLIEIRQARTDATVLV
jgi:predicted acylesterase/phospholipase RssA